MAKKKIEEQKETTIINEDPKVSTEPETQTEPEVQAEPETPAEPEAQTEPEVPEEQEPKVEKKALAGQDTAEPQLQQKKDSGCEPVLYYINTTEDEVMVRSAPSMLDPGNVVDIIKEPAGEKEDYPISKEYNGWGKIQNEEEWIYLKYTRRVAV